MVLYHWKQVELFNYLESQGCKLINDDYPGTKVYCGPNNEVVPIKIERSYYHPIILRTCEDLGIDSPPEFVKIRQEFINLRKACEKNPFKKD
jgi:hypothetical protein